MFSQGFGQRDYLWNQVVDIYEENGNLNDKVVRVRRRGSGMQDTNYSIQVTNTATKIPDESKTELDELGNAIDFFIAREENSSSSNGNGGGTATATKAVPLDDDSDSTSTVDTLDELFDKDTLF